MSEPLSKEAQAVMWVMGALRDLEYEGFIAMEGSGMDLTMKGVAEVDQLMATYKPTEIEIVEGLAAVLLQPGWGRPDIGTALKIGNLLKTYRDHKDKLFAVTPRSEREAGR